MCLRTILSDVLRYDLYALAYTSSPVHKSIGWFVTALIGWRIMYDRTHNTISSNVDWIDSTGAKAMHNIVTPNIDANAADLGRNAIPLVRM